MALVESEPAAQLDPAAEDLVARLTVAAYDVALRQGIKGPFTDFQSALWQTMRGVIRECCDSSLHLAIAIA